MKIRTQYLGKILRQSLSQIMKHDLQNATLFEKPIGIERNTEIKTIKKAIILVYLNPRIRVTMLNSLISPAFLI